MPEEDNESLEKFFREGTRRPDIKFNEKDWLALKARLDAEAARSAGIQRKRIAFFAGCLIVILTTMFVGFWHNYKNINDTQKRYSTTESGSEGNASKDSGGKSETDETVLKPEQAPASVIVPKGDPVIPIKETESENKHLANRGSTTGLTASLAQKKSLEETPRYLSIHLGDKALSHDFLKVHTITEVDEKNLLHAKSIENRKDKDSSAALLVTGKERNPRPHFSLMFFGAPEFSFSNRVRVTSPGRDYGIALYFHFNQTISFSGGLITSRKKYVSAGDEYRIKEGYWKANTNGIVPDRIIGSCNVLEIPVMLQLRLLRKGNNYFFIASGTSSYFMLNESYNYKFDQPNPGAKNGWSTEKNTTFAFSTINFSISYERNISRSITIGLEPYAKLAVKKIGWPNLELFSSGVNVNLRYKVFNK